MRPSRAYFPACRLFQVMTSSRKVIPDLSSVHAFGFVGDAFFDFVEVIQVFVKGLVGPFHRNISKRV